MKGLQALFYLLAVVVLATGCETEVNSPVASGPYPVVYCVLDMRDTAHYVRLTKTFSGPVDAGIMAQNPDSLYYKNARVFAEMPGVTVELEPTNEARRDPGIFFSGYSILYKTTYRLCGEVRIHIILPDYGTEIVGKTTILSERTFTTPDTTKKKVLSFYEQEPVRIIWNGVPGVCETTLRFKYLEATDTGIDSCHVDWIRKNCDFAILPVDLLDYLNHWISDNPEVNYRRVLGFDILVKTGNGQMSSYMTFKDWSVDIAEKPYSNVTNAYGLIASRGSSLLTDYQPNSKFLDTLVAGRVTKHLKFVKW